MSTVQQLKYGGWMTDRNVKNKINLQFPYIVLKRQNIPFSF